MSDSDIKLIRKQIKNVVQQILPEIITKEMQTALYKELSTLINGRLGAISSDLKQYMDNLKDKFKTAAAETPENHLNVK